MGLLIDGRVSPGTISRMNQQVIVAGGGIGGLACALALARAGVSSVVLEQAAAFGEVGAGLQLGPNAVRVLAEWGLMDAVQACAAFPEALRVRDAHGANQLGHLRLGAMALARHGQHYATLHRADLHGLLLSAVQRRPEVQLRLGVRLASYVDNGECVQVTLENGETLSGGALIGCDGLWSRVRAGLLGEQPVSATSHLAYRGMVRAVDLPAALRANVITAWLGPRLHVVHYPVKQGDWFNLVAVVHGRLPSGDDVQAWTHQAHAADLRQSLGSACAELMAMALIFPERISGSDVARPTTGVADEVRVPLASILIRANKTPARMVCRRWARATIATTGSEGARLETAASTVVASIAPIARRWAVTSSSIHPKNVR